MLHDRHSAVELRREPRRGGNLGLAHPGFGVDDLPLQVRTLHHVVVDDTDDPDPGRAEVRDDGRPQTSGADDEDPCVTQRTLPRLAHTGQRQVARVTQALTRVEWSRRCHRCSFPLAAARSGGAGR